MKWEYEKFLKDGILFLDTGDYQGGISYDHPDTKGTSFNIYLSRIKNTDGTLPGPFITSIYGWRLMSIKTEYEKETAYVKFTPFDPNHPEKGGKITAINQNLV